VLFSTVLSDYTSNNCKLATSVACRFRLQYTIDHITSYRPWLFSWCISKM